MAQALLNNLNILNEDKFNFSDKTTKIDASDFEKILDSKTTNADDSETKKDLINSDCEKEENITVDNTTNKQKTQNAKDSDNKEELNSKINILKTLGDIKKEILEEDLKNQILETVTENQTSEEVLTEEVENLIVEETIDTDTSEISVTEEKITQDTNITDEETTMYKETNAPENPTTVVLLSQIQTTVKLPVSEKNTDVTEKEVPVSKKTNDNFCEMPANKQFDDILSKDMPIISNNSKPVTNASSEQTKQPSVLNEKIVKELNIESVNTETTQNPSSGDLMQNQSPQEQTVKIMIQGDIKPEINIEVAKSTNIKPVEITPSKIIEQISKQLEGMYNNSKLEMVLNPGTLGKLHLQLMNTKDGLVAQFTVTTQEARDLLMKGLNGLKESLLAQGINVDSVSIKFEESESDNSFDWDEQEGSQGGNKQQGTKKQKEEKKPFEQMMFEIENDDNLV